jgi:hypothetical protein
MENLKKIQIFADQVTLCDMEENLTHRCGYTGSGRNTSQYYKVSFIPFAHRGYSSVNEHEDWKDLSKQSFGSFEEHFEALVRANPKFILREVCIFRHTGEHLEWSPSCRWDSRQIGCIAVRRKRGARMEGYETAIDRGFKLLNDYWFSPTYSFHIESEDCWTGPLTSEECLEVAKEYYGENIELDYCG